MAHFPVINSTLCATHLGVFLQEKYVLGTTVSCNLLKAGINDTYLIACDTSKYVFRVYSFNWRSETEITEEIGLLHLLRQNNISISYPIADKENNYIQVLHAPEGDRFAVLFSFAAGEKLHNYAAGTHFAVGALMAQFHNITAGHAVDRVTYTPQVLLIDSLKQVAKFLGASTDEMAFMQSTQQYLLQEFARVDIRHVRQGIVHLDIWFDNMHITGDNAIILFDFDFCGNGWLCLDIAYYLMQLHVMEPIEAEYRAKADHFLQGYASITPISDEEKRMLPMLGVSLYFFYLGVQCQRFDNYSSTFISETYLKRYVSQRVKKYFDFCGLGVR